MAPPVTYSRIHVFTEKMQDDRLDLLAQLGVRISDPRHAGRRIERPIQRLAAGVGNGDAGLLRDEQAGAIVGVTAHALRLALGSVEHRAQVGVETVVADYQFVELAAGR